MRPQTFAPGDGGFLYIDLLVSLTLITLCAAALFSAALGLKRSIVEETRDYTESIQAWEQVLENGFVQED